MLHILYSMYRVFVLLEIQYRITIYNNVFWALNQHNIKQHGHILKPSNFLSIEFLIFFNLKYDSLLSILPRNAFLLKKRSTYFWGKNLLSLEMQMALADFQLRDLFDLCWPWMTFQSWPIKRWLVLKFAEWKVANVDASFVEIAPK